jgi:hypothetical protein
MSTTTPQSYLNWSVLSTVCSVATIALLIMWGDSDPEPKLEMPVMMKRPELSLPESPLLHGSRAATPSSEAVAQFRQQLEKLKKLEANMMNGELERFKNTPAGFTDPDSMWHGQMMRADKALHEAGLPSLNVRKF